MKPTNQGWPKIISQGLIILGCISCFALGQNGDGILNIRGNTTEIPQWSIGFGIGQGYHLHVTWRFPKSLHSLPAIRPSISVGYLSLFKRASNFGGAPYEYSSRIYLEELPPTKFARAGLGKFVAFELQSQFIWNELNGVVITGVGLFVDDEISDRQASSLVTLGLRLRRGNIYGEWRNFLPEYGNLYRGNQLTFGISSWEKRKILAVGAMLMYLDLLIRTIK